MSLPRFCRQQVIAKKARTQYGCCSGQTTGRSPFAFASGAREGRRALGLVGMEDTSSSACASLSGCCGLPSFSAGAPLAAFVGLLSSMVAAFSRSGRVCSSLAGVS